MNEIRKLCADELDRARRGTFGSEVRSIGLNHRDARAGTMLGVLNGAADGLSIGDKVGETKDEGACSGASSGARVGTVLVRLQEAEIASASGWI